MSSTLSIYSNISSLKAQRQFSTASNTLSSQFEKLSSGFRINKASDDAAGLAISQTLKASTRVYTQALRNLNDGLSYLAIGEGALRQLSSITTRQLELAEQSASGVYTLSQRRAINAEADALANEYNRIVQSTSFNGRNVLDLGQNGGNLLLQGGYGTTGTLRMSVGDELSRTVGTGTFTAGTSYEMSSADNEAFEVGDINGDGKQDIVSVVDDGGHMGFALARLGNGDGTFLAARTNALDVWMANGLALTDVDSNGVLDIVAGGDNAVSIALGLGDGTFQAATTLDFAESMQGLAVSDIDNNGTQDLVAFGPTGAFEARLGNGNGTFTAPLPSAGPANIRSLSLADIDSDGLADLLTASDDGAVIQLGNGDGTFKAGYGCYQDLAFLSNLFASDIDGNGTLDLLAGGDSPGAGRVSVRLGDGKGQFGQAVLYSMNGLNPQFATAADVNNDGIKDIVAASNNPNGTLAVLLGNGDGGFKKPATFGAGETAFDHLKMADVNNDGVLDALAESLEAVSVCLGNTTRATTMPHLNLLSQKDSREALDFLKNQLDRIASEMGAFGSFGSRLVVASNVLQVSRENFLSANSRIEDADIGVETASLARIQILQQAASAVLAQANQAPSIALKLLG